MKNEAVDGGDTLCFFRRRVLNTLWPYYFKLSNDALCKMNFYLCGNI